MTNKYLGSNLTTLTVQLQKIASKFSNLIFANFSIDQILVIFHQSFSRVDWKMSESLVVNDIFQLNNFQSSGWLLSWLRIDGEMKIESVTLCQSWPWLAELLLLSLDHSRDNTVTQEWRHLLKFHQNTNNSNIIRF